jgi:hypothetical protein
MLSLTLHRDSHCAAVTGIAVEIMRDGPGLSLRYVLSGDVSRLVLPPPAASLRTDALWRHTCFEAFVQAGDGYLEFNFAPSTEWAAYRFDGYREDMRPANVAAPQIEVVRGADRFELLARLDLDGSGLDDLDWRVGLSAVVEGADKQIAYWALKHPPGRPDFHNADCFALELPESRGA